MGELSLVQVQNVSSLAPPPPWLLIAPHHPFHPRSHPGANEQWHGWRLPGRSPGWCHAGNKRLWQGRDDEATILEHQTLMEQYSASSNNWQTIGNLFTSQIKARGKLRNRPTVLQSLLM